MEFSVVVIYFIPTVVGGCRFTFGMCDEDIQSKWRRLLVTSSFMLRYCITLMSNMFRRKYKEIRVANKSYCVN